MDWFLANWQTILLVVFGIMLVYAGFNIRKLLKELHDLTGAVNELMGALCQAAEDNHLSSEEAREIRQAWGRVMVEAKDVGAFVAGIVQIVAKVLKR